MRATKENYIYLLKERLANIEDMDLTRDERDMLWLTELHKLQDEVKRNEEEDNLRQTLQREFREEEDEH